MSGSQISGWRMSGFWCPEMMWPGLVVLAFLLREHQSGSSTGPRAGAWRHVHYLRWSQDGYLVMPPWVHPTVPVPVPVPVLLPQWCPRHPPGSKWTLRNSQMAPEVNLRRTIWVLAPYLVPCCKNQLVPKAPDCLGLSNPCRILSRVGTLP